MEKENTDLEHQPIQIIEACTKTLEEKSCPLKEKHNHEQIDVEVPDEQSDVDIQGEKQHVYYETYDTEVLEDRKEVEVVIAEPCDERVHKDRKEMDVMVLDGTKRWHLKLRNKVV